MGILGSIVGGVGDFVGAVGGVAVDIVGGAIGGVVGGISGGSSSTVNYGSPVDYSTAMMYQSDNNKTVALGQIMGMQMSLQQASLDREMQLAAQLELGIEKLDTKLQVALLEYRQQMTAAENQHVEEIAQIKLEHARLESGGGPAFATDLPPPDFL